MEQPISPEIEKLAEINEFFEQNRVVLFRNPETLKTIVKKTIELKSIEGKEEIISKLLAERKIVASITEANARNYSGSTPYSEIYADRTKANRLAVQATLEIIFSNTSLAIAQKLWKTFQAVMDKELFTNNSGSSVVKMITDFENMSDVYGSAAYKNFNERIFKQFELLRTNEANLAFHEAEEQLKTAEVILAQIKKYQYSLFENQQVVDEIVRDTRDLEDISQQQIIVTELLNLANNISKTDGVNARIYPGGTPENVMYANRIKANTVCMPAVLSIMFPNSLVRANAINQVLQKHLASTNFNVAGGSKNTMISDYMKTRGIIEYNAMIEFNKTLNRQFDILRKNEEVAELHKVEEKLDEAREIVDELIKEEEASLNSEASDKLTSNSLETVESAPEQPSSEAVLNNLETVRGLVELEQLSPEQLVELNAVLGGLIKSKISKLSVLADEQEGHHLT